MTFARYLVILIGLGLVLMAVPGLRAPVQETRGDTAQVTTTSGGIRHLSNIEMDKLSICSTCPYGINHAPKYGSGSDPATHLAGDALVIGLRWRGVARAYPTMLLRRPSSHIINDNADGVPFMVTWCPLCHSGMAFERPRMGGQALEFGTAGAYKRDLVMYDAQTLSLWLQMTSRPLAGPLVGTAGPLRALPAELVPWEAWKQAHPDTQVLLGWERKGDGSRLAIYGEIGHGRDRAHISRRDTRLDVNAVVVGIVVADSAKAYLNDALARIRIVNDTVGGIDILALRHPVSGGARFFRRRVAGNRLLMFALRDGTLMDEFTGTVWSFDGVGKAGALTGTRLEEIPGVPAYWFAWATFFPRTEVFK